MGTYPNDYRELGRASIGLLRVETVKLGASLAILLEWH